MNRKLRPSLVSLLLVLGPVASAADAQVQIEEFPLPTTNLAIFGVNFTADFLGLPLGTITGASVDLTYTSGGLDAADLILSLQAPSTGVPVWQLTGADLGWSGTGTFTANLSTGVLNGPIDFGDPLPDFSLYALDLRAVGFQPLNGQFTSSAFRVAVDPWLDLGSGLAGTGGVQPQLDPSSTLQPGTPFELLLTDAPANAPVLLILGFAEVDLPALGGTLVPDPLVIVPFSADSNGVFDLQTIWPTGLPKGLPLYAQFWVFDPGGPMSFSATQGVKSVTP